MGNNITSKKGRLCGFCHSEEGLPRLIGGYVVELTLVDVKGEPMLACQGCRRKEKGVQFSSAIQETKHAKFVAWVRSFLGFQHT